MGNHGLAEEQVDVAGTSLSGPAMQQL